MNPEAIIADAEIACMSELTRLEQMAPMTPHDREIFRLGFLAGEIHGLDLAKLDINVEEKMI